MIVEELQLNQRRRPRSPAGTEAPRSSSAESCSSILECPHLFPSFLLTISELEKRKKKDTNVCQYLDDDKNAVNRL